MTPGRWVWGLLLLWILGSGGAASASEDPTYEQAINLASEGAFEEAIGFIRTALEVAPDNVDLRLLLGGLLDHTGRAEEAVAALP